MKDREREAGVNLFILTSLTTQQNVYYQCL